MNRVVVTGIGIISPLGNSLHESWNSAKKAISGIRLIDRFDISDLKWKVAGLLKGFEDKLYLFKKEINRLDPFVHYAVSAAIMALEDAEILKILKFDNYEIGIKRHDFEILNNKYLSTGGVIIGSSRGGIGTIEKEMQRRIRGSIKNALEGKRHFYRLRTSAYLMPSTTISMASSYVAQKLGIRGYCLGISNACASGTNAIGEAYRLIRSGYQGPVLCGGTEAPICRLCIEGYGYAGLLSSVDGSAASRPFDKTRDGFVLSEGASILVLEDYKNALKRGVRIYGEIIGYGNTTDAFHQTVPSPEGEARAIKMAIEEAGLNPEEIDFISAHGTSTVLGDRVETEAIKIALGSRAYHIPITSVKSMTGHMLAASGSLESAFTLMSLKEGIITPTINLKQRDPECDLDYVTRLRRKEITYALSNSFGFGGINAVLLFRKLHV